MGGGKTTITKITLPASKWHLDTANGRYYDKLYLFVDAPGVTSDLDTKQIITIIPNYYSDKLYYKCGVYGSYTFDNEIEFYSIHHPPNDLYVYLIIQEV